MTCSTEGRDYNGRGMIYNKGARLDEQWQAVLMPVPRMVGK